jgi:hypothetical protein
MKPEKRYRLDALLKQQPLLWKASEHSAGYQGAGPAGLDTGFPALNCLLRTGGWPRASLIEIQVDEWGQGELQLLLPVMAALSQQKQQLAWIAPPYIPYAPALHAAGVDLNYLLIIEQSEPGTGRCKTYPTVTGRSGYGWKYGRIIALRASASDTCTPEIKNPVHKTGFVR